MKPPTAARSNEDWSAIRAELETRREKLHRRTQRTHSDLRRGHLAKLSEQALERENDEVLEHLDEEGRAEIAAIDDALARIERGSFGVCAGCSNPIEKARLRALPFAATCMSCASSGET